MSLPAGVRLGSVRLQVASLDRSLAFYRDRIGFSEHYRDGGMARLGGPGGPILLELVEEPGVSPVPRSGLLGIYHFALLLPGRAALGRFVRHLTRNGLRFGAADHAFSEAVYIEDPDGITLEVYADRPEDEWPARHDGSLPLVSDPLDAAGLMAAAGDGEWAGVPEGAVVGHVHLFVGDLDRARAFYVDGLGFDPMIRVPSALFVSAGGYHHHVGLNTWRAGAPVADDDDARLLDWELVVPGATVDEVVGRLEDGGFPVQVGTDAAVARDPWGIRVRVTH